MTEKHFIISVCEDFTVKKKNGEINRNSNSTQFLDVELDGWKLNEGEELYIELSHYNDDTELTTNVGPLHLIYIESLGRYVTLAPPELVCVPGTWNFSLELRSEIRENRDGQITYNSITSAIDALTVIDSIIAASPTNSFSKETELLNAAKLLTGAILVGYTAEEVVKQAESAKQSEQNAAQSAADANTAKEAAETAQLGAAQAAGAAAGSASSASSSAVTAQTAAHNAENSATAASNSATEANAAQEASEQAAERSEQAAEDAIKSIGAIQNAAEILVTAEEVLEKTEAAVTNMPVRFSVTEAGLLHIELNDKNEEEEL